MYSTPSFCSFLTEKTPHVCKYALWRTENSHLSLRMMMGLWVRIQLV
jgi:hypothetical protein